MSQRPLLLTESKPYESLPPDSTFSDPKDLSRSAEPLPPSLSCPSSLSWWIAERSHVLMVRLLPLHFLVQPTDLEGELFTVPAHHPEAFLRTWLHQRPDLEKIVLDATLTEAEIKVWATSAQDRRIPVSIAIPPLSTAPEFQARHHWGIKRILDRGVAALLVIGLFPLLIGIAMVIKLETPGPIFFRQWRVGHKGRLFQIIKFRTMTHNAEQLHHQVMGHQAGLHKLAEDPRITPSGRWLRKFSLDELPQLFNVLLGNMSLVGPRPWALYDAQRIPVEGLHRLNALPGITGSWQVTARSHVLDLHQVNLTDLTYLQHWSLGQDFKILLMTIPRVISGFGAV